MLFDVLSGLGAAIIEPKGLHLMERKGLVKVDADGMTERDGVFSAGDVVLGPWNVVQVVKDAKHVAEAMIRYLEARGAKS